MTGDSRPAGLLGRPGAAGSRAPGAIEPRLHTVIRASLWRGHAGPQRTEGIPDRVSELSTSSNSGGESTPFSRIAPCSAEGLAATRSKRSAKVGRAPATSSRLGSVQTFMVRSRLEQRRPAWAVRGTSSSSKWAKTAVHPMDGLRSTTGSPAPRLGRSGHEGAPGCQRWTKFASCQAWLTMPRRPGASSTTFVPSWCSKRSSSVQRFHVMPAGSAFL